MSKNYSYSIYEAGSLLPVEFYAIKGINYEKSTVVNYRYGRETQYIFVQQGIEIEKIDISKDMNILLMFVNMLRRKKEGYVLSEKEILKWCGKYGLLELTHTYNPADGTVVKFGEIIDEFFLENQLGIKDIPEYLQFTRDMKAIVTENTDTKKFDVAKVCQYELLEDSKAKLGRFKDSVGGCPGFSINEVQRKVGRLYDLYRLLTPMVYNDVDSLRRLVSEYMINDAYEINYRGKSKRRLAGQSEKFEPKKWSRDFMEYMSKKDREAAAIILGDLNYVDLKRVIAKYINEELRSKIALRFDERDKRYRCFGVVGSYIDAAYVQLAQLLSHPDVKFMMCFKQCASPGCHNLFWAKHGNAKYCDQCGAKEANRLRQKKYREEVRKRKLKEREENAGATADKE